MKLNWRLNALYKNLARVRMSRSNVKSQGHWGQKRKSVALLSAVVLLGRRPVQRLSRARLCRWENQRMLSSLKLPTQVQHEVKFDRTQERK